jgi:hypothetical protein
MVLKPYLIYSTDSGYEVYRQGIDRPDDAELLASVTLDPEKADEVTANELIERLEDSQIAQENALIHTAKNEEIRSEETMTSISDNIQRTQRAINYLESLS